MPVTASLQKKEEVFDLSPFKKLLLSSCGHSFENERGQALHTGLCRRMAAKDIVSPEAYHSLLLRDQDELQRLTELLTVNETYFFREPEHLNLIIDKLVPEFMSVRNRGTIRILSAGCSTGEEPYSIAIMLRERFGAESERLFTITGVDIDSTVIASARQGAYGKGSFRGMSQSLLERYFEPVSSGKLQVSDIIKKQVGFEVVNLLGAAYPQRMLMPDIILYRNVSIYFPQQIQREIFGKLAELLAEGGCLLVGASETFHHDLGILSLIKQDSLFFYRKIPKITFQERRTVSRHAAVPGQARSGLPKSAPTYPAKPESTQNRAQHGTDLHHRKHYAPAVTLDVRESFDSAIALAHSGQFEKALAILDAIIQQDIAFEKAHCLKGSLLVSLSRFDEAQTICDAILTRDSLCLEAYLMLGIIARQKGNDDEALRRFREAVYLSASCWLAHFYSAEISYVQRDEKRARSGYEAVIRILEKGSLQKHGQDFFPLSFNAEQFSVICKHKLTLLASKKR